MQKQKEMEAETPEAKKEVAKKERDDAADKAVEVGKQQDRAEKLEKAERESSHTKDERWTMSLPENLAQQKAKHGDKEEESESESEDEEESEKSDNESEEEESDDEEEEATPAKKPAAAPKKAKAKK